MKDVMLYKDYVGSVHYSEDDEIFFGKIEGIDDLVNFEGISVPELKKAFYEAVDDYIAIATENGKKPEKTFQGSLNIRLKPDVHKKANLSLRRAT
ncbi:MAG: type II toxin-antitoxin system HicB family antitoxin [Desulfobacula sp.]|jgi:predicted HicB family RNase H-like nuclease